MCMFVVINIYIVFHWRFPLAQMINIIQRIIKLITERNVQSSVFLCQLMPTKTNFYIKYNLFICCCFVFTFSSFDWCACYAFKNATFGFISNAELSPNALIKPKQSVCTWSVGFMLNATRFSDIFSTPNGFLYFIKIFDCVFRIEMKSFTLS